MSSKLPSRIVNQLRCAFKLAQQQEISHKFYICAIICNKNQFISVGFNSMKTHSRAKKIGRTIHAELSCLIKSDGSKLDNSIMVIARAGYKSRSKPAICKPCINCQELILSSGVKSVYYTIDCNTVGHWDVKNDKTRTISIAI
jgi:deoxycytidylate deaminase